MSFYRKFSATMLCMLWSGIEASRCADLFTDFSLHEQLEEGKNVFSPMKTADSSFEKVMDLCVKAGTHS